MEVGGSRVSIQVGTAVQDQRAHKENFDLWEADRDPTDAAKTYQELLNKTKDYSRRRKLDSSAKEKTQ